MTAPRQILPGVTYLISRRCSERRFLLKPSPAANDAFRFILAVTARRYDIQLHAFCFLSNHLHLVLTDSAGNLPDFERDLGSLLARSTNARLGRWESFWAPNSYSAVALQTPDDVVAKTAYVLANPVAAGLVRHGREWPGLWSSPRSIGAAPLETRRPTTFFRPKGPLPETARLQLTCPPGFASASEFATAVAQACAELEDEAARALASEGRSFLGVAKVLAQKPFARPAPGEPRRGLNPRVASRDKWKRIEALQRMVTFLRDYREALGRWTSGVRDVVFPEGTFLLRRHHGAACAACG